MINQWFSSIISSDVPTFSPAVSTVSCHGDVEHGRKDADGGWENAASGFHHAGQLAGNIRKPWLERCSWVQLGAAFRALWIKEKNGKKMKNPGKHPFSQEI